MSTDETHGVERDDPAQSLEFYLPATLWPSAEPGRIERFVQRANSSHRR